MTNANETTGVGCTLHEAAQAYLQHLKEAGKKERTIYTYGRDLEQIEAALGRDRRLASILPAHVGKFLKSDALLKLPAGPDGAPKPRAKPTVDKTVRVLRMFLVWAHDSGRIDRLPLPKGTPLGRSQVAAEGSGDEH